MLEDNIHKDIQGVAIYAEWSRPENLTQIFITPDGFNSEGHFMRARMYRRTVSISHPRKQWRSSPLMHSRRNDMPPEVLDDEEKARSRYTALRIDSLESIFFRLTIGGWEMNSEPLMIEMSKKDFDDMGKDKTPNKFLYRVDQSKKAKGNFKNPLEEEVAV
jgi:hypothetical protein